MKPAPKLMRLARIATLGLWLGMVLSACGLKYVNPNAVEDTDWRTISGANRATAPKVLTAAGTRPGPSVAPAKTVWKAATLPPPLSPDERPIIAVMEIEDKSGSLEPDLLVSLTDYFRASLVATGRFSVVDKSRQSEARGKLIKAEKEESYKACYDRNCQIPLGQALAADRVLSTNVGTMGSKLIIRAEIVDLAREVTVSGGVTKCDKGPRDGLEERLMESADQLILQLVR